MSPGDLVAATGVTAAPDISIGHLLLQMVVAMVLVVGGIWGFGKLMGRSRAAGRNAGRKAGRAAGGFFRPRAHARAQEQGLSILSRQPVGKGKYIAVVQVGAQQFLVGIADSGLTPLGELRADELEVPADARGVLDAASPVTAPDFGPADLANIDLDALGVRPLDLGALPSPLGRAATASTREPPRSVRSLVDVLREATVRR